jgi:hypothetical protein
VSAIPDLPVHDPGALFQHVADLGRVAEPVSAKYAVRDSTYHADEVIAELLAVVVNQMQVRSYHTTSATARVSIVYTRWPQNETSD